jgi:hypothetical protein
MWLKWQRTCLGCSRPWVQLKYQKKKKERETAGGSSDRAPADASRNKALISFFFILKIIYSTYLLTTNDFSESKRTDYCFSNPFPTTKVITDT